MRFERECFAGAGPLNPTSKISKPPPEEAPIHSASAGISAFAFVKERYAMPNRNGFCEIKNSVNSPANRPAPGKENLMLAKCRKCGDQVALRIVNLRNESSSAA